MMEIHWDWRNWIARGIPDEITLKLIHANAAFAPETAELIALCRQRAIPVSACPFLHALTNLASYQADIAAIGIAAFTAYESATLWQASPEGFTDLASPVSQALRALAKN